jgi:hypothetical protein
MITSSLAHRSVLSAAAGLVLFGWPRLHAQVTDLPDPVRAALARSAALDPLAVTWSQTTEVAPMGREKLDPRLLEHMTDPGNQVLQLAFRDGRIYQRLEFSVEPSRPPRKEEKAFDRRVLYGGRQQEPWSPYGRAMIHKWIPANDRPEVSYFADDYFRAAGIRIATHNQELVRPWHPQSELLATLAEGGRVESTAQADLDGVPLLRVRVTATDLSLQGFPIDGSELEKLEKHLRFVGYTEQEVQRHVDLARRVPTRKAPQRQYDFYLDPGRAYAVRRCETRDDAGHLVARADCTEHEPLEGRGIWMPRRGRVEYYTYSDLRDEATSLPHVFESPLYSSTFRVTAFDLQPWPEDRFALNYTAPGTFVNDATLPGVKGKDGVFYEIPAIPGQLDQVIEGARARYLSRADTGKWPSSVRAILVANGVLLAGAAVLFALRWRKARRA